VTTGKTPSEMVRDMHREFGEFFFNRRDLHMEVDKGKTLVSNLATSTPNQVGGHIVTGIETLDGTKLLFEDESWLLFRQSGTEPVLRLYSEATSINKVKELLDQAVRICSR
jgi:phosphomannomutase